MLGSIFNEREATYLLELFVQIDFLLDYDCC
jgi:hypothetical protein